MVFLNNICWVHGLSATQEAAPVRLPNNLDWRETVLSILMSKYEQVPRRPRTAQAETGLGIPPSWYWFIGTTERAFGDCIFLMTPNKNFFTDQRGATPFDSGGLWHGFIKTAHTLDDEGKREFFRAHECALADWRTRFQKHITEAYVSIADYVLGAPPRVSTGCIINSESENAQRAWLWEARVRREEVAKAVSLISIYCAEQTKQRLFDYIRAANHLTLHEKRMCVRLIREVVQVTPLGIRPAAFLQRELIDATG